MKKYTITIFDNETKDVERIHGDIALVALANVIGEEMECVKYVDLNSSLEEIMRLYLSLGRAIQNLRISERYKNSKRSVGEEISPNTFEH